MTTAVSKSTAGRPRAVFLPLPVHQWMQVAAERRRLAKLDNEQLRDLGLSREQARREAEKPFWNSRAR